MKINAEFFTTCTIGEPDPDCADYKYKFDMDTLETQKWVEEHKGMYDDIILNTCPVMFMITPTNVCGFKKLLKPRGSVILTAFSNQRNEAHNIFSKNAKQIEILSYYMEQKIDKYDDRTSYFVNNKDIDCGTTMMISYICDRLTVGKATPAILNNLSEELALFIIKAAELALENGIGNIKIAERVLGIKKHV